MDWEAFYNRFREPNFIPGYEIQNRLGGGAFGEVYKARKASIGKAYAIKFLKIDDEAQADAALRELEQVRHFAAIDHQNLVTIEDMGTALGAPYLIMGYAGEDTLARRLRAGKLPPEAALLCFVQACRGVLALHDRRLVHFDLKPSNIFLKGDVARVGDYGLAKMMSEGRQTLSFGRGTPQYMAPEMLRNRADHRADIYSLGVILFESLTQRLPFESSNASGITLRESDEPARFPVDFPVGLRRVVERCLRLDPEQRYASVSELLDDLGQTARPGDSVRLSPVAPPGSPADAVRSIERPTPTPRALVDRAPAADPQQVVAAEHATLDTAAAANMPGATDGKTMGAPGKRYPSTSEIGQTAAELARGAALVARGVFEGFRGPRPAEVAPQRGLDTAPTSASPVSLPPRPYVPITPTAASVGPDVIHFEPLIHEAKPAPRALARAVSSSAPNLGTAGWLPVTESRGGSATIPVPPPVRGGWFGTVFSTFALALEVLVSLVRGLTQGVLAMLQGGWRGSRTTGANAARGLRRFLGGALRLTLFVVILALLGALSTLIAATLLGS